MIPNDCVTRFIFRDAWLLLLVIAGTPPRWASATPMLEGAGGKGLAWGPAVTINVFIPPDNNGRDALIKEGIERWKDRLAARGRTLNVTIGAAPAGQENSSVVVRSQPDGYSPPDSPLQKIGPPDSGGLNGLGTPEPNGDGDSIGSGKIDVRSSMPGGNDGSAFENQRIKDTAEHEMGHALGLADDPHGDVMNHARDAMLPPRMNKRDNEEFNSLYGTANTNGAKTPVGKVTHPLIENPNRLRYKFDFKPANANVDPDDPEHVASINLLINPSLVQSVTPPPGWIALVPNGTPAENDPYFTEDEYMLDGAFSPPPWSNAAAPHFIALRLSDAETVRDGLPVGTAALSLDNPSFEVTIQTVPGVPLGNIQVWAGGEFQTVLGPVPEPATVSMLIVAAVGWPLRRCRVEKKVASPI